jgi:hypothetical protein
MKDKANQFSTPAGWTQTESVLQGLNVGFQKIHAKGQYTTFSFGFLKTV